MADNIKDFALGWILAGIIIFSLLTFAVTFTFNNNPSALGENEEQIDIIRGNLSNSLTEIEEDMNVKTNASAQLDSDTEGEGSASSTAYGFESTGKDNFKVIKLMVAWVFAGTFGQLVIKFLSGIFMLVGLYYVVKLIRGLI